MRTIGKSRFEYGPDYCPKGLAIGGRIVLLNLVNHEWIYERELLAEELRRQSYSHQPSRLQAVFACETLADAKRYKQKHKIPDTPVYDVFGQAGQTRHDMDGLDRRPCYVTDEIFKITGEATFELRFRTFIECLMVPPVKVIQRVAWLAGHYTLTYMLRVKSRALYANCAVTRLEVSA